MQTKKLSAVFTAGLAAALMAVPASAIDLGMAGSGSSRASGLLGAPAGNLGGSLTNSWQGSGNASLPVSALQLPSASAAPSVPSLPSVGGTANGSFLGSLGGTLPGALSGNVQGDGAFALNGALDQFTPAAGVPGLPAIPQLSSPIDVSGAISTAMSASGTFSAPSLPGLPGLPAMSSAPGLPIDVAGALSAGVSAFGSVPSLPSLPALPGIPGGLNLAGIANTDILANQGLSIGVGYSAEANGSGISLPGIGLPASASASSGDGSTSGGISVSSTVDAALQAVQGTVATAASFNGGMGPNALSLTPTLTAVASGVTVPSLPVFSSVMPALSLPGSAIAVTTQGSVQVGSKPDAEASAGTEQQEEPASHTSAEGSAQASGSADSSAS